MKPSRTLAYTFWHWRRPSIERATYEERHRAFHAALISSATGFRWSNCVRCSGLPWANGGAEAYQDRYMVDGWATLERLESAAISGAREVPHAAIAASFAGGAAGVYGVRLGTPVAAPRQAYWFTKPPGMSYGELDEAVRPLTGDGAALWIRRMVLGPTPEFCLETFSAVRLPPPFDVLQVAFEPVV